jgi:hypothetical protein
MYSKGQLVTPLALAVLLFAACSTQTKTVKTETVYETAPATASADSTVTRTESTEIRTETENESSGILSGTVDIIGKTLALPFKLVGGLIDLIF